LRRILRSFSTEKKRVGRPRRAREVEVSFRSEILLECHQAHGKDSIKAMKKFYKFSDWKITKENHNIGPQTEAILLVFYNIPCFFSRTELELFQGYKSPNHNVDGALTKMVEKLLLIEATNKVKTEIYYLGHFAMQSLHRKKVPHVDTRQGKYQESITIRSENGFRVRNNRQNITRTSFSNKRQESSASRKSSVPPSAKKKARTDPKPPLSSSDEESSKSLTELSYKNEDGALINGKSTSDDESEKSDDSFSSDEESEKSDEESEKSKHSPPNT
jgi:hypothetical protein